MDRLPLLVDTDYYRNYIWTAFLVDQMNQAMIECLMLVFRCFRYPLNLVSDGALNLVSCEMIEFWHSKDIQRSISSPCHPSSNGKVESAVKIMKSLFKRPVETPLPSGMPCSRIKTSLWEPIYLLQPS